ncbi:hypothetical protein GCM10010244_82680 [Streptomyces coeruleorubidus]|nr:hypothetical protein GCM10010244_82680 [Streptomyces bellus]
MVASDCELKLRGYEVFRFGHDELRDAEPARNPLQHFLPTLIQRFEVDGRASQLTPEGPEHGPDEHGYPLVPGTKAELARPPPDTGNW